MPSVQVQLESNHLLPCPLKFRQIARNLTLPFENPPAQG